MICIHFIVFALVTTVYASTVTDPCKTYKKLDDPDRSTNSSTLDGSIPKCDSTISEDWYRSVSGSGQDMPTTYVPIGMCGTRYPIWVNDSLPTDNAEKEVIICTTTLTQKCFNKNTIKVKNCGDFNIYYLKQTGGCPMRYCFGTKSPCPEGTSSDTGFTPNCGDYPKIPLVLKVTADLIDGPLASESMIHKVMKFDCNLQDKPEEDENTLFDVRWYIEDNMVADFSNKRLSELSNDAYLSEDRWAGTYRMGFNVKCQIRAKYANSVGVGPFSTSDFFYAGFKVSNSEISVKEGEVKKIDVWLTVPLGCNEDQVEDCFMNIRFTEPSVRDCESAVAFTKYGCGLHFTHKNWKTVQYIEVMGTYDDQYGNKRDRHISLRADSTIPHDAWSYAAVPDILVHVSDEDVITEGKQCNIINDPYIITFDRNIRYPNHRLGEFIIYQHETHPTTVHGMFAWCPGSWRSRSFTCICGIAIRNNDELFIANFCGTISDHYVSSSPTNHYIEKVFCDDEHMTVASHGDTYTIVLTTGTTVEFTKGLFGPRGAQVYGITNAIIYPSVGDFEKTGGLCGYFDNKVQARDEFILRDKNRTVNYAPFCLNWKLYRDSNPQRSIRGRQSIRSNEGTVSRVNTTKGDMSLFEEDIVLEKAGVPLRTYCKCTHATKDSKLNSEKVYSFNCDLIEPVSSCPEKDLSEKYFVKCGEGKQRRRRSVQNGMVKRSTDEDDEYNDVFERIKITYGPDIDREPVEATWANGWTQTSAEKHCSEKVETDALISICKDVMKNSDQEVQMIIDQCSETIKVAGDTTFVESTLDALRMGCITQAKRDVNLTSTASRTGNASRSILDDLLDVSCPRNCSGNGVCIAGKCICSNGFEGDMCDLSRSIPPSISQTTNTGKCHTNRKRCTTYGISGSGFINEAVKCRAKHFQIYGDGQIVESSAVLTFDGIYINDISCYCTIPDSRRRRAASPATVIADGYYISVSNDGMTFGEEITFINYDSSCYDCNVTAVNCTVLAGASCIKTTKPDSNKDSEKEPPMGMIIAVVVVAVIGITVMIVIAIKLFCKKNKPNKDDYNIKVQGDHNPKGQFTPSDYIDYMNSPPPRATQDPKISSTKPSKVFVVSANNPDQKGAMSPRAETPGKISVHFNDFSNREKSYVDLFKRPY